MKLKIFIITFLVLTSFDTYAQTSIEDFFYQENPSDKTESDNSKENASSYKWPKMDCDVKFYLPSGMGMVSGSNSFLQLRENWESVEQCSNIFGEARGDILPIGNNFSFAWGFGFGSYFDVKTTDGEKHTSINLSLGAGVYYHPYRIINDPLTTQRGLCLFLYPMYQVPVYKTCSNSFLKWKSAVDVGYNLVLFDSITVYPYLRSIFAWTDQGAKGYLDFGVALGIFFPDYKYRNAHK